MTTTAPRGVHALTGLLFVVGAVTGGLAAGPVAAWWLLAPLAAALIVAESLQVEFQYGRDVRAVDVFEAVLAPVLITFAGPPAVLLAVVSKAVSQHRLGIERTKALFNVAQWAAAVGVASVLYRGLAGERAGETSSLPALVGALLAFAVTNEIAMAAVLRLANGVPTRQVLADLAPGYLPHARIWLVNAALGVLFAVAVAAAPATAFLLLGPLAFFRWSHQAFLSMRADRARLDGLTRAVADLASPIDPLDALPGFLDDISKSFGSTTVELVQFQPPDVLRAGTRARSDQHSLELARLLMATGDVRRATAAGPDAAVAAALLAAQHHDALAAPLVRDGRIVGALISYDRTGFEGFEQGEEAVMVALASAASRALEKSELLRTLVEERRQLAEIVDRSSDGIFTLDLSGGIESWNPAMEAVTGLAATDVVGRAGLATLQPRDAAGRAVVFEDWCRTAIPDEVLISTADGERWLGCSSAVGGGGATLVVVARDI
ncbi:MAG: PAS domain S-box protein, partial [Microthrixaceae bacterium]